MGICDKSRDIWKQILSSVESGHYREALSLLEEYVPMYRKCYDEIDAPQPMRLRKRFRVTVLYKVIQKALKENIRGGVAIKLFDELIAKWIDIEDISSTAKKLKERVDELLRNSYKGIRTQYDKKTVDILDHTIKELEKFYKHSAKEFAEKLDRDPKEIFYDY